jgi:hypothetical protein
MEIKKRASFVCEKKRKPETGSCVKKRSSADQSQAAPTRAVPSFPLFSFFLLFVSTFFLLLPLLFLS